MNRPSPLSEEETAELVRRYPLPEGALDAVLNREELAEAFGTSTRTITAWLQAGMPVQQEGDHGRAYELRVSHCYAWNEARKRNDAQRSATAREAIASLRLALVGGKSGNSIEALDPKQRREILTAQIAYEDLQARRNKLLRRDDVVAVLELILASVRDTMEATPDRIERAEPTLPPKAVSAFVQICDDLVDEVARRIHQYLRDRPVLDATLDKADMFND